MQDTPAQGCELQTASRIFLFDCWLGFVLIAFAVWDFRVNKAYYFGDDNDWGQPNL